ncbi:MAG: ABC transporter ATP-binding protein [Promethearchaeota archaeon]
MSIREKRNRKKELDAFKSEKVNVGKRFSIEKGKLLIKIENVSKDYEIGEYIVRAVDDVSLKILSEEFIVIKGHSGAGKTTFLNLLGGLDKPSKGRIYSMGIILSLMDEESLALFRLINSGFIFQNYNLISTLTAEENVIFPMRLIGMSLDEQRERAVKLLNKVDLSERREHLPFQLSAGEQQRVAIARALANDPPIILADEPTANLDKKTSQFVRDLFRELKINGKTIIIATHDDYLIDLADRIINFDDGKISEEELAVNNKDK